jgi:hypothetical protein
MRRKFLSSEIATKKARKVCAEFPDFGHKRLAAIVQLGNLAY